MRFRRQGENSSHLTIASCSGLLICAFSHSTECRRGASRISGCRATDNQFGASSTCSGCSAYGGASSSPSICTANSERCASVECSSTVGRAAAANGRKSISSRQSRCRNCEAEGGRLIVSAGEDHAHLPRATGGDAGVLLERSEKVCTVAKADTLRDFGDGEAGAAQQSLSLLHALLAQVFE